MVKGLKAGFRTGIRSPYLWLIAVLFIIISIPHYRETGVQPALITDALTNLGLTRHAFERILYLFPVLLGGLFFGWKGSTAAILIAFVLMLPRSLLLSQYPVDAIFETFGIVLIGGMITFIFYASRREKEYHRRLQSSYDRLKESEERYHRLFEDAHDAVLIYNATGEIQAVNGQCVAVTGYSREELCRMKMEDLLSEDSYLLAGAVEQLLLRGEETVSTFEAVMIKKDGSRTYVNLTLSLISPGEKAAFQCTARDISEQKSLQESLRYYLQQATRAQEEERKRIARELHDDTIQELIVLSRQLDNLLQRSRELTPENISLLKEARRKTSSIIQSLRNISQDLRPVTLDRLGLISSLDFLASETTKHSGIAVRVNVTGEERRPDEEVELMLFRIAQEAITNVARHSQARTAEIKLKFAPQQIELTVADDGRGFQLPERINELTREGKLGLVGMQERARLINARFDLKSEPGKGTVISIVVPG